MNEPLEPKNVPAGMQARRRSSDAIESAVQHHSSMQSERGAHSDVSYPNPKNRRKPMNQQRTRRMWFAGTAIAAALSLTACATSPSSAPEAVSGPIDSAVISLPAPNLSFDPTSSVSATDRVVNQMINATLMTLEFDGTVTPGLAESYEFNDDFTVFTAKLIEDATFSDGSPLTAADVAATFTRHKGVEGSTIGSTLDRVTSIEADGDYSVVFTFPEPYPSFVSALSQGALGIVPAASLEDAEGYYTTPDVTSGQYTVASNWSGNKLELVANEEYFGPQPIVENLTLTIIEDANSAISQLQGGQIDVAGDLAPNFVTQIEGTPGINVLKSDVYGFYDLRMWNQSGPFADVNMRKAVNAAIDREAIVASIWGTSNEPQSGFWPASMEGHEDKSVKQDLEAARGFLAQTDCADGCSVRMMYSDQDFPFSGQLALMVQSQLSEVGIDVQLEKLDASTMIDRLFAGDYDMVPGAMASTGNVPDPLLANALLGTGFLKAEFTGYNSDEMNALIQTVNVNDGEARSEAVVQIEELFSEDQPYVTLAPWVRGSASTLPDGVFSFVGAVAKMGSLD